MSNSGNSIKDEAIREVAGGGGAIPLTYVVAGSALTRDVFRIWMTNNTNGDVYVSTNGVTDQKKLPSGSGRVYDDKTNDMYHKAGTQFYIRSDATNVVSSGWFALEIEYV